MRTREHRNSDRPARGHLQVVADGGSGTSAVQFAGAARVLAVGARALGLQAPTFRSPPGLDGVSRSLRRRRGTALVSVRIRGRPWPAVQADMVEGVIAANRLSGTAADEARTTLWVELSGGSHVAA